MERQVLLITAEQKQKLYAVAQSEHISISEAHRRAIDQYLGLTMEELATLDVMADALARSIDDAEESIVRAEKEIMKTLQQLRKPKNGDV